MRDSDPDLLSLCHTVPLEVVKMGNKLFKASCVQATVQDSASFAHVLLHTKQQTFWTFDAEFVFLA